MSTYAEEVQKFVDHTGSEPCVIDFDGLSEDDKEKIMFFIQITNEVLGQGSLTNTWKAENGAADTKD